MSRDHRKLRVFHDGHHLTIAIYRNTRHFPKEEWFGIRMQMRRAAVSMASNVVEGCARRSTREYCNFLNIACGSAAELSYLVNLAYELEFLTKDIWTRLHEHCERVEKQLERLFQQVERLAQAEKEHKRNPKAKPRAWDSSPAPRAPSPEPRAD